MNNKLYLIVLAFFCLNQSAVEAKRSFGFKAPKTYIKKAPCAGLGKISKINGRMKTNIVSSHVKRTSKGMTLVNPYARSN